ncbi:amidohydrolase [Gordonia iterans]|uniref:Amidohydrolase n=2 Tax=Gordonia iterans TaxID=1004901 RepID=A0A2S0KHJ8_9ACTN|nr:amidohydrolase [Gordonia iterans]
MGSPMKSIDIVTLRHELHQIPEVGLHLPITQRYLLAVLDSEGIDYLTGESMTSVTIVIRGGAADRRATVPTVLVRSDMDALPVAEETNLPWASTNGAMHACGHDAHMAIVLAATVATHRARATLQGDAIFFFQPGEEGHGGAQLALAEGLLDVAGTRPIAALGLHVLSNLLDAGQLAGRPGPILSGSTLVDVNVSGRGGHGSTPHLTASPLAAAAAMVGAVGAVSAHSVSMFEPATVGFGALRSGEARNVVPDHAVLQGVIRTFDTDTDSHLRQCLERTVNGIAMAHDVEATVTYAQDTVPTESDPREFALLRGIARGRGIQLTELPQPIAISEDFSWILRAVPGVFVLIGAGRSDSPESNHSPRATFSDDVLAPSADLVIAWVQDRLAAGAQKP